MQKPLKTIAVLVANPALSSILVATLADCPSLRVRSFSTELALGIYLRMVPTDLVVVGVHDLAETGRLAQALRDDFSLAAMPQIIALAGALGPDALELKRRGTIDEIIVKPMSPQYLVERVLARVAGLRSAATHPPLPQDWSRYGPNVVPLFGPTPAP
jgi:hypothetical protein